MSAFVCPGCGRRLLPTDAVEWATVAGFRAPYCKNCLVAHDHEFPRGRIPGKSARQETGAASGLKAAEKAGPRPQQIRTTRRCKRCGRPATLEILFPLGWEPRCEKCIKEVGYAGARPIAPAPVSLCCPKCGDDKWLAVQISPRDPIEHVCLFCGYRTCVEAYEDWVLRQFLMDKVRDQPVPDLGPEADHA